LMKYDLSQTYFRRDYPLLLKQVAELNQQLDEYDANGAKKALKRE
jgi:hypothetical protein